MPTDDVYSVWLPVIGRALAFFCLDRALQSEPDKFDDVLKKVKFLQNMGLSLEDAAVVVGSTAASVRELMRYHRTKGSKRNGAKKKKAHRR